MYGPEISEGPKKPEAVKPIIYIYIYRDIYVYRERCEYIYDMS